MTSTPVEDDLWDQFHRMVNMSAAELEAWHRERSAGAPREPTGPPVLAVLRKRRVELTAEDAETMRVVVAEVLRCTVDRERDLADGPVGQPEWRERLCALGHDPLLPDPG
jgi:hypothetical protein